MKLRYTVATLTLGIISSQATIVSPANVITGDAAELPLVIDNSGTLLADGGGSIAIGSFNSTNYVDFSAENFRQFGAGVQALSNNLGASGGFFNAIEFQEDSGTTGDLTADGGKAIFVVVGDQATLETSTLFAVWESTTSVFAADQAGNEGQSSAALVTGQGALRHGALVGETVGNFGGTEVTFTNGIQLTVVPEPSTSLLAALAGLGLVARRRR